MFLILFWAIKANKQKLVSKKKKKKKKKKLKKKKKKKKKKQKKNTKEKELSSFASERKGLPFC